MAEQLQIGKNMQGIDRGQFLNHLCTYLDVLVKTVKTSVRLPLCWPRSETKSAEIELHDLRFEVFTAVTMKNGVFWDVTPCGSSKNRRFRGT
jgi:hypothetical protein